MFAVLTIAVLRTLRAWRPLRAASLYTVTAALIVGLAVATEFVQGLVGRDSSWADLRTDLLGAGCALCVAAALDWRLRCPRGLRVAWLALATAAAIWVLLPVVEMARAYSYRNAIFPALATFNDDRDLYWTVGVNATTRVEAGALRVGLSNTSYPGVSWQEPPRDWSAFDALLLEVENPTAGATQITVRVHDATHDWSYEDRFNRAYEFKPYERRVLRIALNDVAGAPKHRKLDLTRISDVSVFRSGPPGAAEFRIYQLRLTRNP